MVRRSLVVALVLAAGACGEDVVTVISADATVCGAALCDPLAAPGAQGCAAGEKCTALILLVGQQLCPEDVQIGCVPAGAQALGAECIWTSPGREAGHDDCVAGAVCASDGVCRDICGFGGTAAEACTAGLTCVAIPGRFEPQQGGEPAYGVCAPPL